MVMLDDVLELDKYKYSVAAERQMGLSYKFGTKTDFIWRALKSEYSLHNYKLQGFWVTVFSLLLAFWLRTYIHYSGQYVFLMAVSIPVSELRFRALTVNLNYQGSLVLTKEEVGVVAMGPIAVYLVLLFFFALVAVLRLLRVNALEPIYRFVSAFGVLAVLDPILVLLVDVIYRRWHDYGGAKPVGDAFKLYYHFSRSDDGGLPGVFLTIFIYLVIILTGMSMMYVFYLKMHMNGRIVDLFQRFSGGEETFAVPYDTEVSMQELSFIVQRAERWRGRHGERRKVLVYDYNWTHEPGTALHGESGPSTDRTQSIDLDAKVVETTTHVSIYTLRLNGTREVFRQFLRLPDGAVVEVFGDGSNLVDERLKAALHRENIDLGTLHREATRFAASRFESAEGVLG